MDPDSRIFVNRMNAMSELLLIKASQMTKYQMLHVFKLILISVLLSLVVFRVNTVIVYLCIIVIMIMMLVYLLKYYESDNRININVRYNSNDSDEPSVAGGSSLKTPSDSVNIKVDKNKLKEFRKRTAAATTIQ